MFQRMVWLSSGRALPGIPSAPNAAEGPSLEASFRKNREKFLHVGGPPLSHVFTLERANAPSEPLVVVETEGGREELRYVYDGFDGRSEALLSLHHPEGGDADIRRSLYPVVLSDQPIGRDRRDPLPAPFVLSDVRVDLTAPGGETAELVVHETLVPQRRSVAVLQFHLTSVSYESGFAAINRHPHRVRAVLDESGKRLAFHHEHGDLLVALDAPAPPNRPVKLKFEIEGDYLIRPGGDNFWLLGTSAWFPQPALAGQYYTFHARVKVKKPFVAFAPGKTIARSSEGDFNVVETDVAEPVQFAVVLAGRYEFEEETRNGITIRVASYALRNQRAVKQLSNLAFGIIEYYQRFLGPFPFTEFNILEINAYGFGQAPPAMMFITKEAFNPYIGAANQLYSQGVNERFAHEIAHQYWGHAVKMPSEEEQWLTESFAEYSAALFLRDLKGKSTYQTLLAHWKREASQSSSTAPIPLANRVASPSNGSEGFRIRTDLLYSKGPYLLAALHRELGEETFLTFLKSYQKSFRWKFGSTKSVAGLLAFMTKKDYAPFFEKYYWGTALP
ncbi:MAG: M1 family aminopeptidase [Acidobacteriota bacterium]